ncbi:DUF5333 domain-containing protein [Salibaculum griseiflavum]|uniref:DUF5333 domain-containing protein n=1 Tax=Salibaculum griseiflavum TaxID=1914409 RepID=A0A2V1P276_9RHOB|nr:DUF5333 domain-containing protein [Salibaculum griseiflavum]PWG16621.1 hypothetical protein DFK10_10790 [Salibaculum griseiflavum]
MNPIPALALGLTLSATPLAAKPPLSEVPFITEGLIDTGIAYEISEVCDDIHARMLRGLGFLLSLERHALDIGYSRDEVDAYIDNKQEAERLEAIARARLADMGAVVGQPETYCDVGRREIAAGSQIGRLLR